MDRGGVAVGALTRGGPTGPATDQRPLICPGGYRRGSLRGITWAGGLGGFQRRADGRRDEGGRAPGGYSPISGVYCRLGKKTFLVGMGVQKKGIFFFFWIWG